MIMDARTGKITRRTALPKLDISTLALSPDQRTLLTADTAAEAIIKVWDSRTGKRQRTVETGLREISNVAFSPDCRSVVATCPGVTKPPGIACVKVWDTKTWKPVWSHRVKEGRRPTIAHFTREGKWLAVGMSILSGNSGAVLVWDWKRLRRSFEEDPLGE
jgi:WD40 repeat protein